MDRVAPADIEAERQRLAALLAAVDWSHESPEIMRAVIGTMLESLTADDLFNVLVLLRWHCLALPALEAAATARGAAYGVGDSTSSQMARGDHESERTKDMQRK